MASILHCSRSPRRAFTGGFFRRWWSAVFGAAVLGVASAAMAHAESGDTPVDLELRPRDGGFTFVVCGLPSHVSEQLQNGGHLDERCREFFQIHVGKRPEADRPPMLGRYHVQEGELAFVPRYPLKAGLHYSAWLELSRILPAENDSPWPARLERSFEVPSKEQGPRTTVAAVYPSADVLPENQLKFYLHFSAPVRTGDSFRYLQLRDAARNDVGLPFVNVGQELWDREGTRLTLLLDPGRIKRGLKPREELGPILEEGKSYVLEIDAAWRDAQGRPLAKPYRKAFSVAAPDDVQPDPHAWKLHAPPAETREPLRLVFNESLDHAMLHRVIGVQGENGDQVLGQVEVREHETEWRFQPETPWKAGAYQVVVDVDLEDLAGNSIRRPFEVDIFERVDVAIPHDTVALPFRVE